MTPPRYAEGNLPFLKVVDPLIVRRTKLVLLGLYSFRDLLLHLCPVSVDDGEHEPHRRHLGFHLLQLALNLCFRRLYGSRFIGTAAKFRVLLSKTSDFRLKVVCFARFNSLILKCAFSSDPLCTATEDPPTKAASSRGYGSGASARTLYALRNAFSAVFARLVKLSISV
jgi:hypothetical protein